MTGHEPTLVAYGLMWRVECSCGYRTHRREHEVLAWDLFDGHLARIRRGNRQPRGRATHRTAMVPRRYV